MPMIDGISRKQVQLAALQVLTGATMAEDRVYVPRDWPTTPDKFPLLLLATPREKKVGLFPGLHEYTVTITLAVIGRCQGPNAEVVSDNLDLLAAQVEEGLMVSPFSMAIQKFTTIDTTSSITAEGRQHLGEIGMIFELEVYQAYGPSGPELTDIQGAIQPVSTFGTVAGVPLVNIDIRKAP